MATARAHEALGLVSGRRERLACILVHASDRGGAVDLCRELAIKITGGGGDMNVIRLREADKDRLYAEVFSISMFGGEQVVWLSAAGDGVAPVLEQILTSTERGNLILIDSDALPKSSKLRKLCEASPRAVTVPLYEETTVELRIRLSARLSSAGLSIADDAMEHLLQVVARERAAGTAEIEKLITYAHGKSSVMLEDVIAICGDSYEASADDILDAVFEGSMADADRFSTIFEQASSRSALAAALAYAAKLETLAAQVEQGQSPDAVARSPANGIFFKRQQRVARQLRLWTLPALLEAEQKIGAAILQARQERDLEAAITSRTLLAVGWLARSQSA
jgi:DNA polymerase III subunit delta